MSAKTKLELTWIGKNNSEYDIANIEPRILEERTDLSYGDKDTENMVIHGDNLLALKALLPEYEGLVKCVYIDPPFNINAAGVPYEDNIEHSLWLSLMKPRLELLKNLLSPDGGLIFVHIDDEEMPYLSILMDEIFGRFNRLNIIAVKMSEASGVKMAHVDKKLPKLKEFVLVYKKDSSPNLDVEGVPLEKWNEEYKTIITGFDKEKISEIKRLVQKENRTQEDVNLCNTLLKPIKTQTLSSFFSENDIPKDDQDKFKFDNAWRIIQAVGSSSVFSMAKRLPKLEQEIAAGLSATGLIYLYKTGFDPSAKQPRVQVIFADDNIMQNPGDFWQDIKTTGGVGQEGGVLFPNGKKPEALLKRIIGMCTKPGDIVLDSFGGSGTSGAVAHKMGRQWIMVELGDHCYTHVMPRLKSVIDGTDQSGITKTVGWKGGGGFKFYELAPSFIAIDEFGNPVIDSYYNDTKLIRAMCKLTNYAFAPSPTEYWKHGKGQGNNSVYVTTQMLSVAMVQQIASHLSNNETLLICPKKFEPGCESIDGRITIKKIPQSILKACQFGKKEYLLPIKESAIEEINEEDMIEGQE